MARCGLALNEPKLLDYLMVSKTSNSFIEIKNVAKSICKYRINFLNDSTICEYDWLRMRLHREKATLRLQGSHHQQLEQILCSRIFEQVQLHLRDYQVFGRLLSLFNGGLVYSASVFLIQSSGNEKTRTFIKVDKSTLFIHVCYLDQTDTASFPTMTPEIVGFFYIWTVWTPGHSQWHPCR